LADEGQPPAPVEPIDRRWWGIGDVLIAVALALFAGSLAASLPAYNGHSPVDARAWSADAMLSAPWIGLLGWSLIATRWKGDGPIRDLRLRLTPRDAATGVAFAVAGILVAECVVYVQVKVTGHPINSTAGDVLDQIRHASVLPLLLFQLLAVVGAPIVEEIVFRGLLFGALEKRGMRTAWCVVISAGTFVLYHLEPSRIFVLLPIALALALTRARTGSTAASIVGHMTNNLFATVGMVVLLH
jgi:membrane protease YdiL (CAAX protease family)